jgi:hypothetical protein
MPSPWRWLYAQLYNWNVRKWGRRRDPEVFTLGALTAITSIHFLLIFVAYAAIAHKPVQISRPRTIEICAAIGFFFYVRFVRRGEADSMIAELEIHDAAQTRNDFRQLGAVVLGTFAFLVLAAVARAIVRSPAE